MRFPNRIIIITLSLLAVALHSALAAEPSSPAPSTSPATAPASTVPPVVMGLKMSGNSPDSVTLEWYHSPDTNVTSYNVYTSDKKDGTYTRFATVNAPERTATDTKLAEDTKYFYKVSAVNAYGEGAQSPIIAGFTFKRCEGAPFPVRIATNMCVSLGATIVSTKPPTVGK